MSFLDERLATLFAPDPEDSAARDRAELMPLTSLTFRRYIHRREDAR